MRHILVTGGFGYVGGRVAQALSSSSEVQIALGSRRPRGSPEWLAKAPVVVTDWNDFDCLRRACRGLAAVFHLAAMNEIEASRDPAGALEANGVYTSRLVEAAKAEKVNRFVYLSTAHVYRSPLVGQIDETTCPRPVGPYATSHRAAEDVILAAHDAGALTGIVIRLSNGFGAPAHKNADRWTLLVNDLCKQAATNRKLVLRSAGMQARDFVTLHDVGRAMVHMFNLPAERVGNGIFNVGGAWAPTVFEMAQIVQARCQIVLGFSPEINRPEAPSEESPAKLDYRIDKIVATGFQLTGDYATEIDATLRFCSAAVGRMNE